MGSNNQCNELITGPAIDHNSGAESRSHTCDRPLRRNHENTDNTLADNSNQHNYPFI